MRRGLLLKDDQRLFRGMWQKAEFHIPACEKAAHPLAITSILLSIDLEQEKSIYRLEETAKAQRQAIQHLEQANESKRVDILLLKAELEFLHQDMEVRLKAFRAEMLEIKYDLVP
ncbi:MAG: hypothetical protein IH859_06060 [Chloroflexi bacterium]|nr:hypothetical protein [Chloroflexota bacterium]